MTVLIAALAFAAGSLVGISVHGISDKREMLVLKEKHRHEYEMYLLRKELGERG